jgi:hypothetical protein
LERGSFFGTTALVQHLNVADLDVFDRAPGIPVIIDPNRDTELDCLGGQRRAATPAPVSGRNDLRILV